VNYDELGLMIGLEIHQELATRHKLFCSCPPKLFKGDPENVFVRSLRPSQGELGKIDPAALFEFMKGKKIVYEAHSETSCLVEMDEEPPGCLNVEAIDVCLTFSLLTDSKPVDEVHVMRKVVVDGSNTTGFQRTCVISLGGSINLNGKIFRLQQICLEEDAARKISEKGEIIRYRIDRLGIPLIEVTTSPDINSPQEAEDVALAIGKILRATGKVRRGLGTIRQDLNISIKGGAIIEVKGVQDINLITKIVELEVKRQAEFIVISNELRKRGLKRNDLEEEFVNVSEVFKETKNRIIKTTLKRGLHVFALKLPKFAGILEKELCTGRKFGTEIADRVRFYGGVKGLIHTDELPDYEIADKEIRVLREKMEAADSDAVVLVADDENKCKKTLSAVFNRVKEAFEGVPSETRAANIDGTTHFTRPRPGPARMYPETDVEYFNVTVERINDLRKKLPEMPEKKITRIMGEYGINEKLAKQVVDSDYALIFEEIANDVNLPATLIAVTLTETFRSLDRDGFNVREISYDAIKAVFNILEEKITAKEALPEIFKRLAENPGEEPLKTVHVLGLAMISEEELKHIVSNKIAENKELIERMGDGARGPLLGMLMEEVRGRALPKDVIKLIQEAISTVHALKSK